MVPDRLPSNAYVVRRLDQLTSPQAASAQSLLFRRLGAEFSFSNLFALLDPSGKVLAALAHERDSNFITGIAQSGDNRSVRKATLTLRAEPDGFPRSPAEELLLHVLKGEVGASGISLSGNFTAEGKRLIKRLENRYGESGISLSRHPTYSPQQRIHFLPRADRPLLLAARAEWRS